MSKQPEIKIPVAGGHWQLLAHAPYQNDPMGYSAHLYIADLPICHAFSFEGAEFDGGTLMLGHTHIELNEEAAQQVVKFLADTAAYITGEAA